MALTIPTIEPDSFTSGDTVKWTKSLPSFLPADGWVLTYHIIDAATSKSVVATDNGDGTHAAVLTAALNTFSAGSYHMKGFVTKGTERFTVFVGTVVVQQDLSSGAADVRSHAKITLDAIEATLENRATQDQRRMQVAGRLIERMHIDELLKLRAVYKAEYARERRLERMANGLPSRTKIMTRMRS